MNLSFFRKVKRFGVCVVTTLTMLGGISYVSLSAHDDGLAEQELYDHDMLCNDDHADQLQLLFMQMMKQQHDQALKEQARLLTLVDVDDQHLINAARNAYEQFVAGLTCTVRLQKSIHAIRSWLHSDVMTHKDISLIDDALTALESWLPEKTVEYDELVRVIFCETCKKERYEQITLLINNLKKIEKLTHDTCGVEVAHFCAFLQALMDNNQDDFIKAYHALLAQELADVAVICASAQQKLTLRIEGLPAGELYAAYKTFCVELGRYGDTIQAFQKLYDGAVHIVGKTQGLYFLLDKAVAFYETLFSFYKKDVALGVVHPNNVAYRVAPYAVDGALRSILAVWNFLLASQKNDVNQMVNIIGGSQPIDQLGFNVSLVKKISSLLLLFNPQMWSRQHSKFVRSLGRGFSALFYYHIRQSPLFSAYERARHSVVDEKSTLPLLDRIIPRDDSYFKQAMASIMYEAQKSITHGVERKLRSSSVTAAAVEKVERATLGVIKPELLGYSLETFLPLMLLDEHGVVQKFLAHLQPGDVYDPAFLSMIMSQEGSAKGTCSVEQGLKNYAEKHGIDIKKYYIEYRFLKYLFTSCGGYIGNRLGKRYHASLHNACDKGIEYALSACVKIGLLSEQALEYFTYAKQEITSNIESIVSMLAALLEYAFDQNSLIRKDIISLLQQRSDIFLEETELDYQGQNKKIFECVVYYVAESRLITYLEALDLIAKYDAQSTNIGQLIVDLGGYIKGNIWAAVGESIGTWLSGKAGDYIMRRHGPFYSRVNGMLQAHFKNHE